MPKVLHAPRKGFNSNAPLMIVSPAACRPAVNQLQLLSMSSDLLVHSSPSHSSDHDAATDEHPPANPATPSRHLLLQRRLHHIDSIEADLRREWRHGPALTPISRILGDSDVFLEHWQSLAGSSPTAALADVCQWLQRSLGDNVSPGSIAKGFDMGRQAIASPSELGESDEQTKCGKGEESQQEEEESRKQVRLRGAHDGSSMSSSSSPVVSRLLLSITIVATLHCRRGELIFEYMAAASAPTASQSSASVNHTLNYHDFQQHLPLAELGFSIDSTLMEFSAVLVFSNRSGGAVDKDPRIACDAFVDWFYLKGTSYGSLSLSPGVSYLPPAPRVLTSELIENVMTAPDALHRAVINGWSHVVQHILQRQPLAAQKMDRNNR